MAVVFAAPACATDNPDVGVTGSQIRASQPTSRSRTETDPAPETFPGAERGASGAGENPGDLFRFAVKGDWGAGTRAQSAVSAQMCERRAKEPYNDVVTTGDNFYRPDGVATEDNYHRPEQCLIRWPAHRWRAVWGNHDVAGDSTLRVLGSQKYYVWTAGPAELYMLDSNRPDAAQTAWLESKLVASRAKVKIAVFHHPPFTSGTHESNIPVRRTWVPIFERHRVSLVLSGHNHLFEHLKVNNVHYVVSGGGGAALYGCDRKEPWLIKCHPGHHYLLIEVGSYMANVRAVDSRGAILHRFEFETSNR